MLSIALCLLMSVDVGVLEVKAVSLSSLIRGRDACDYS